MMRSLYSGVSGLRTHQTRMDVIGNNIANVNTTAYKAKNITFSDMLYQTTQSATGPNTANGTAGTNPRQIGLGVKTGAINTSITTEGATQSTGNPFDLKLTGEAFFVVSDGKNQYFTRDGSFNVDAAGYLCMGSTGYIVQGWTNTDAETGAIIQDSVKPIQVMSEKNATYPAAYTTKATISGIIDGNDDNLLTTGGRIMNVQTLDNRGYEYNLKFGIKPVPSENAKTMRNVSNTETQYTIADPLYEVDNSKVKFTYTDGTEKKTLSDAENPKLMEELQKDLWNYINSNYTTNIGAAFSGNHQFGTSDASIKINLGEYINNKSEFTALQSSDLVRKMNPLNVEFEGSTGFVGKKPAYADYPITGASKIDSAVVSTLYNMSGRSTTASINQYSVISTASILVTEQKYVDDSGETVTEYKFEAVTAADGTKNPLTVSDKQYEDMLKLVKFGQQTGPINKYTTQQEMPDKNSYEKGKYTIELISITDSNGADVDMSRLKNNATTKFTATYDTGDGKFKDVDGDTSFSIDLSLLNGDGNFSKVTFDMSNTSNVDNGGKSNIEGLRDDGRKVGTLTGVAIGTDGVITANYSNGMSKSIAQIAVATFANAMGLQNEGDNLYSATANSGEFNGVGVDIKASGTGYMTTGVLEMSNVDLSQQFTDMITTQRGFQANSRIITTSDTLLEELVNLKR